MRKYILFLLLLSFVSPASAAEVKEITLSRCAQDALQNSYELKRLEAQASAAASRFAGSKSAYYPSLSFDAKGSWVSHVAQLEVGPVKAQFGDNWGYSAGPSFQYVLFDHGARYGAVQSEKAAWLAARDEYAFARKTVLLNVRTAYFAVQQDLQRMYFTAQQLKVAQKQLADIEAAFKAGAKSRLDVSTAQKQALRAQVNISAARAALGAHLRELFKLTGVSYGIDPSYPADWRMEVASGDLPATAVIKADSLEDTLLAMTRFADFKFDENSSKISAFENMARYYERLAEGASAALYPSAALSGGAFFEYPDGPIRDHVFLARAGVNLKIPLFEGSKSRNEARAHRAKAASVNYQKLDLTDELRMLFYLSRSMLRALDLQARLTERMIEAGREAAELTYDAFKAGAVTFLEVDNANLNLLQSRIALADIYVESLNRLALLDNLGVESAPRESE